MALGIVSEAKIYNGKFFQIGIDRSSGKSFGCLPAGLRNATVRCSSDEFTSSEVIPKGSTIFIGKVTNESLPVFCVITAGKDLSGRIGTKERTDLFGCFDIKGNVPLMVMPAEPNRPLKGCVNVFILTDCYFAAGEKMTIKLFFTRD